MTKLRVPMWTVYMSKDGSLHAYDTYAVDKPPVRAKNYTIGYVNFKKKQQAIDYCLDMGYKNSYKTDHLPMRPWQRGEILFYYSTRQLSLLHIAEKTNRSIDWVQIVCGIQGRAKQELINMYIEEKDNGIEREFDVQPTVAKKKVTTNVQGTHTRKTSKRNNSRKVTRTIPKRHNTARTDSKGHRGEPIRNNSGKQGIADNLRKSKDYKGE